MLELIKKSYDIYKNVPNDIRVKSSIPILYFGDYPAYKKSRLRIITVGLNPSPREFPEACPFRRFPKAKNVPDQTTPDYACIETALNEYFKTSPYDWFDSLHPVLSGFDASYCSEKGKAVALHTDLCSPVATSTTWSKLKAHQRKDLLKPGIELWHELIHKLEPHIILVSLRQEYLRKIQFLKPEDCSRFIKEKEELVQYAVTLPIGGTHSADLVFGRATRRLFGRYSDVEKEQIGEKLKGKLKHW